MNEVSVRFTGGETLGELGRFLQRLATDAQLRQRWSNPASRADVIAASGLTGATRTFLGTNPDVDGVRGFLEQETGPGNRVWICVWIR